MACGGRNRSVQNLGTRKREDQSQGERLRRLDLHMHIHFECIPIGAFDPTPANSSTNDSNAKFITGGAAQNFADMQEPAAFKTYMIFADEIFALE